MSNKIKISFIEHLYELKIRLIYVLLTFFLSFVIAYFYADKIYNFLLSPLANNWHSLDKKMIYTNLAEFFFSYLKLSYYSALFITIPFLFCQIYLFIAPGLYKQEKQSILPFVIISPILFLLGAIFVYYVIFPFAWKFFLSFEQNSFNNLPVKLEAKISEYMNLTINMIIAFGIAFQMPVILALLAKMDIISADFLQKKRKFAVVFIFILAAILTPPDAITQIGLAIPMLILYELSILAIKNLSTKEK